MRNTLGVKSLQCSRFLCLFVFLFGSLWMPKVDFDPTIAEKMINAFFLFLVENTSWNGQHIENSETENFDM